MDADRISAARLTLWLPLRLAAALDRAAAADDRTRSAYVRRVLARALAERRGDGEGDGGDAQRSDARH